MTPRCRPVAVALTAALALPALAADKRPMTVDDLFKFKRVASPQISPDGTQVVYQVTTVDLDGNKTSTALWTAATDGKTPPKPLTLPEGKKDTNPRWSPDGKKVLFESNRAGTGQLFVIEDGKVTQVTNISTGAGNGVWSPDGKSVAFVSAVFPEFSGKPFAESDKLNKEKDDAAEKNPVKAKVFTKLFYRHWVEYVGDKRQHLFVCDADGKNCRDVTPGDRDAYPTSTTFSSGDDFTFSPDGKHLVFTAVPAKDEAWSTNYDICRVSVTNTSPEWETLTADNKAADSGPKFSPDGTKLAWRAQKRAGYEADAWDIQVADCGPDGRPTGPPKPLLGPDAQRFSVNDFVWAMIWEQTNARLGFIFSTDQNGAQPLYTKIPNGPLVVGLGLPDGSFSALSASRDGTRFACIGARMSAPPAVYVQGYSKAEGKEEPPVSHANDALLAELDLPKPESVEVAVEGGVKMQMWVLKPPGFDPKKKWPVAYLVHGGPQSAWEDGWSWRWNPEVWAAQGYVVVLPNPRGSTGFGQKFVDEISGDWGGKCYRDLVAGLDYVEALPYVDKDRIGAAGASFGGYMMDWFAVNDIAKRLKCLISHCSVWNFESMWGTTDELWFDEYEHG
ncbi:MAG: S9 family peptidase, partial [Gemmataceae bacterium]|nr:S9 family peptidase [Gemmataceae bacterium]